MKTVVSKDASQNTSPQQLTKELVEIFKLRAPSLAANTFVLYWPVLLAVVIYSFSFLGNGTWDYYWAVQLVLYVLLAGVFFLHSLPRIGLDRVEKRFWIKRYLTKREVVTQKQSRAFIQNNEMRIVAYKRLILFKEYLLPALITSTPIIIAVTYLTQNIIRQEGGSTFAYVFLGSLAGIPLLITGFLLYWLYTRNTLLYAWERFVDAVDEREDISNQQLLREARQLAKSLGFRGKAKFMSYDFAASVASGVPAAAVTSVTRFAPKPVAQTVGAYAMLYSFNAYQLQNLAITYSFYLESKAKLTNPK